MRRLEGATVSNDALQIVRDFCATWSRCNLDEIVGYFTDDAVYHNIPMQALRGIAAIRAGLEPFLRGMKSAEFDILHIAADGDVVLTERVDRFELGERKVEIPVMGVFELRDGKIAAWRDYFDLEMYQRQLR